MKKLLTATAFALLAMATVQAEQLSPTQALARMKSQSSAPQRVAGKRLNATPVFTSEIEGLKALYVFNSEVENGGYAILSADDAAMPVLGYSDSGTFDPDNIPDNMAWWLSQYAKEIKWAVDNGLATTDDAAAPVRRDRAPIAPLLTSRWDQSDPYNRDCPQVNGERCVTGCVATAMAQIMNYHKWPQGAGKGSTSYEWNNTTLSMNFEDITFDWDNMADIYDSGSTEAQQAAVAKLMNVCGISIHMNYRVDASGAQSAMVARALTEYFDYDKGIQILSRDSYTLSEWEALIYNELAENRPVQYSGYTLSFEGHAFVCDGYNDGYFHINWGWGGMSDGYFLTSVLDPYNQGIGGAQSGMAFVTNQKVIVGIQKNKGTTTRQEPYLELNGDFLPSSTQYSLTENVLLGGQPCNGGYLDFNGVVGLKFVNTAGGTPQYVTAFEVNDLPPGYYYSDDYTEVVDARTICDVVGYTEADYIVSLAYCYNGGEWHDCLASDNLVSKLKMSVKNNKLVFDLAPDETKLSIESVTILTPLYANREFEIKATATVQNEYNGTITVHFLKPGTNNSCGNGNAMHITIESGSREITYASTIYSSDYTGIPAGDYDMVFVDGRGFQVSDRIPVTLKENPGNPVLTFSDLHIVTGNTAPQDNVQFAGKVTCTGGYFCGPMKGAIFTESGGSSIAVISSENFSLEVGETKEFLVKGALDKGVVGDRYLILPWYYGTLYTNVYTYFTLTEAEGSEVEPTGISLNPATLELEVGKTAELTATIRPANATLTDLDWTVEDTSVADVEDGVITAIAPGSTTVYVTTANGLTATCDVTVNPKTPSSINDPTCNGAENGCKVIDGCIVIYGEDEAEIYTASGQQVYHGAARRVAVEAGVYIVRIGGNVTKVVVR